MNETRYFLLWLTPSILQNIIFIWLMQYANPSPSQTLMDSGVSLFIQMLVTSLFALFFTVLILALGMDFAKKIGARLLLLRDDYSVKNDIIKPALVAGLIVSGIILAINLFYPLSSPFYSFVILSGWQQYILRLLNNMLSVISYDIGFLLVWVCGLSLLIRSIFKNISTNRLVYGSIVFVSFMRHLFTMIIRFMSTAVFAIDPIVNFGVDMVLGVLFWKKGFETTVLCHLIIVFIVQIGLAMLSTFFS